MAVTRTTPPPGLENQEKIVQNVTIRVAQGEKSQSEYGKVMTPVTRAVGCQGTEALGE